MEARNFKTHFVRNHQHGNDAVYTTELCKKYQGANPGFVAGLGTLVDDPTAQETALLARLVALREQRAAPGRGAAPNRGAAPGQGAAPVRCAAPSRGDAPGRGDTTRAARSQDTDLSDTQDDAQDANPRQGNAGDAQGNGERREYGTARAAALYFASNAQTRDREDENGEIVAQDTTALLGMSSTDWARRVYAQYDYSPPETKANAQGLQRAFEGITLAMEIMTSDMSQYVREMKSFAETMNKDKVAVSKLIQDVALKLDILKRRLDDTDDRFIPDISGGHRFGEQMWKASMHNPTDSTGYKSHALRFLFPVNKSEISDKRTPQEASYDKSEIADKRTP
eukprot:jgi/Phyca11/19732/fgenesh1_pg.PHYCAscaffold_51_\